MENFLIRVHIVKHIRPPHFKLYSALESREKTFEKCQLKLKQSIKALTEAGFFYAGRWYLILS